MLELFNITNPYVIFAILFALSIAIFFVILGAIMYFSKMLGKKSLHDRMKDYQESFYEQTIDDINSNKTSKNIYESLDLLLSRSQLKYNYSFNVFWLCALMFSCFFFGFYAAFAIIEGLASSLTVGFTFACVPIVLAEMLASSKAKQLKNQTLSLIPILINNAKLSDGDIYKTIKESSKKTKQPIKMYLEEFCSDYENGVYISKCFEKLKSKVSDYKFRRIIDCLENHLYKGGNVVVSLSSLNKEYMAREIEEDRRKKENSGTSIGILLCVIMDIFIVFMISKTIPEVIEILKRHEWAIALGLINILISLVIAYNSSRINSKENL